ncbi:MAG: ABC transporter permease [Acidimicrobiales bacterium]
MSIDKVEAPPPAGEQPVPADAGGAAGGVAGPVLRRVKGAAGWESWAQSVALPVVWVLLVVAFGALRPTTFLTGPNFESIFGTQAPLLVLSFAILLPLTAGDYDLSAAANLTLTSMVLAVLNVNGHWPVLLAALAALGVGVAIGAVNAVFIVLVGIDSFIVTLGTGTFLSGVALWISGSTTVSGIASGFTQWTVSNRLFGLPMEFFYGVALMLIVWYILELTAPGSRLLFVGRGREVARLSGVAVGRTRAMGLIGSGFLSAVAGLLYAGTLGAADPTSGVALLLPAFAAAFLGATAIRPGRFNALGTFIAVYFLATGINGLTIFGASSFVQDLFYGGALVLAVAASRAATLRHRRGRG